MEIHIWKKTAKQFPGKPSAKRTRANVNVNL
jgi:hypothetical protein